jgi:C-terminal processing protease CtpA/Prc
MNASTFLRILFSILFLAFVASSCEVDDPGTDPDPDPKPVAKDSTLIWIEKTMRAYYLWEDEIPKEANLDYTLGPEEFFTSLLSRKDGKTTLGGHYYYSSINPVRGKTKAYLGDEDSYGFEFLYYNITDGNETLYYALHILYVIPGSPAGEEGVKRGDWVLEINGQPVPGDAATLVGLVFDSKQVSLGLHSDLPKVVSVERTVSLTKRAVIDDPVMVDTTYTIDGKRISYMLYNHFTDGPEGDSERFHNSMRRAFSGFSANNPDYFILDLRYNPGGFVRTAQILSTMIAPASALGDVFLRYTYNNKLSRYNDSLLLDPDFLNGPVKGANINMKKMFVITSNWSASASEAVINGLRPYMEIIIIGEKTEGKNVASVTFTDDRYDWELHPIINYISNKDGFSDYTSGFTPDYPCVETQQGDLYEMGDTAEFILNQTLRFILDGRPIQSKAPVMRAAGALHLVPEYASIERRRSVMNIEP